MNRREFASWVSGGLLSLRVSVLGRSAYGTLTPAQAQALRARGVHLRVMLDGRDVSSRCTLASDREGWVDLQLYGSDGGLLLEPPDYDSISQHRFRGRVEFRRVSAEEWSQLHEEFVKTGPPGLSQDMKQFFPVNGRA